MSLVVSICLVIGLTTSTGCQSGLRCDDSWASFVVPEIAGLDEIKALIREEHRPGEAAERATELLAQVETARGADSLEAALVEGILIEARRRRRDDPAGLIPLAREVLAAKSEHLPLCHPEVAETLGLLGLLHLKADDYQEAENCYRQVREIRRFTLGPKAIETARSSAKLGYIFSAQGDYESARPLLEESLAITLEHYPGDHIETVGSYYTLAQLSTKMHQLEKARGYYENAIAIFDRNPDITDYRLAFLHRSLAILDEMAADYPSALARAEEALRIVRTAPEPDRNSEVSCLEVKASALMYLRDDAEAIRTYGQALSLLDYPGESKPTAEVATILWSMGRILQASMDLPGAGRRFQEALEIQEEAFGGDHPVVAHTLESLAQVASAQGDHGQAINLQRRARRIQAKSGVDESHPDFGANAHEMGVILSRAGDGAGAESSFREALKSRRRALGPGHPVVAETLIKLAELAAGAGDSPRAIQLALEAEGISRDHVRLAAAVLPERQALRYASERPRGLPILLAASVSSGDSVTGAPVLDALVRSRGIVLEQMAGRRHAVFGSRRNPKIDEALARYLEAARVFASATVGGPDPHRPEGYLGQLATARLRMEEAEKSLGELSAEFRQLQDREQAGLDEIRAGLPVGSALVSYARHGESDGSYSAFVLAGPRAEVIRIPLGAVWSIEKKIERWAEAVWSGRRLINSEGSSEQLALESSYRQAGRELREKIWDPVAEHLGQASRVFVVPDGAIHLVNLGTLPDGENSYLVEAGRAIHYLTAERDLLDLGPSGAEGTGLLAVGGPAYGSQPGVTTASRASSPVVKTCFDSGSGTFDELSGAREEATDVVTAWRGKRDGRRTGPAISLTGPEASESAVKAGATGKLILHLATHGVFRRHREEMVVGAGAPDWDSGMCASHPLLQSGLVFAGANLSPASRPGGEDAILTALEVATMDLSGMQWAVLSACGTGIGSIQDGEGVLGLQRAFQIAGARTVIMSLWSVEDWSTRAWMRELYRARLEEEMPTVDAVRAASLAVLEHRRQDGQTTHPFFWGAFVASGDWR